MTVAVETPETIVALSGSGLGPFATNFKYELPADVKVALELDGAVTVLVAPADFTLTATDPLTNGGSVTVSASKRPGAAWPEGAKLRLWRETAADQQINFAGATRFDPTVNGRGFDRLTRMVQDLFARTGRAMRAPVGEPGFDLPRLADRKGRLAAYDLVSGQLVGERTLVVFDGQLADVTAKALQVAADRVQTGLDRLDTAGNLADAIAARAGAKAEADRAEAAAANFRTVESFGAVGGKSLVLAELPDDTEAVLAAVAWANANGQKVRFGAKVYNVRETMNLTGASLEGVGSTNSGTGADASTVLLFSHLGAKPAIRADLAASKKQPTVEGIDIRAVSWDPVTGCAGYGAEVSARVIFRDLSFVGFGKSNLFLHGDAAGMGGPYYSLFESCRFLLSKEHGTVVGTGANSITFLNCEWKKNGATVFGVSPAAPGNYDGLFVDYQGDGNPGGAYFVYQPDALTLLGGDASYNSRYGFNFLGVRNSGEIKPAYAEMNKAGDGQVNLGVNFGPNNFAVFGAVGGAAAIKRAIYGEHQRTNQIWVGGENIGGGGVGGQKFAYQTNTGQVYAESVDRQNQVYSIAAENQTFAWNVNTWGTGQIKLGANQSEYIKIDRTVGVELPWRRKAVYVLEYIPLVHRASALAGTYVGDATAWIQAAINTGKNVDLGGLSLYCAGLTMASNQQELISTGGTANLFKNANGPILTVSGNDVVLRDVVFQGQSASFTGDNAVLTGSRPLVVNCGSQDAAGRALKCTGDRLRLYGTNGIWRTADATATGYDIEVGVAGTGTLYHTLLDVITGSSNGGILMVDTGSTKIIGGQFGKLYVKKGTQPGGSNVGMITGARITGDVTVELSNGLFTNNQFNTQTITFAAGSAGCRFDASNLATSATIVNLGNGSSNLIMDSVGTAGGPAITYGRGSATAITLKYRDGIGVESNYGFVARSGTGTGLRSRNNADTADLNLININGANDSIAVGHSTGTATLALTSGTGNITINVGGGQQFQFRSGDLRPVTDNAVDLGIAGARIRTVYSYVFEASTKYQVAGLQVVGARDTGWIAGTGSANKGAYAGYAGAVASAAYTQAELQAVMNGLQAAAGRIKALEDMCRTHGLIN